MTGVAKIGTAKMDEALLGLITHLTSDIDAYKFKESVAQMQGAIFRKAQEMLKSKIGTIGATSSLTPLQTSYLSVTPTESLKKELYILDKNKISDAVLSLDIEQKKALAKEYARIAWIEPKNLNANKAALPVDFELDKDSFQIEEKSDGNDRTASVANLLSALMKSNKLIYNGGNPNGADLDAIDPFKVADNKILPEHVGLAAHPDASTNNFSRDIILLNNAFRTKTNIATGTIDYDNLSNNYNFDYATHLTGKIKNDNNYYRNNTFVENPDHLQNYENRFLSLPTKDNDDFFDFAKNVNSYINSNNLSNNNEFKSHLSEIIIHLRNIVNGSNDVGAVVTNMGAVASAIIAQAGNGTNSSVAGTIHTASPSGAAAIYLDNGSKAVSTDFSTTANTSALDLISTALTITNNNAPDNIKKAGAEIMRVLPYFATTYSSNDVTNIKTYASYVLQYVVYATCIAASADANKATAVAEAILKIVNNNNNNNLKEVGTRLNINITVATLESFGVVNNNADFTNNVGTIDGYGNAANTARDAAITVAITTTSNDLKTISEYTDKYASALRMKIDPNIGFLKDVIRKIKIPLYNIDITTGTGGKITSLQLNRDNSDYINYLSYIFNEAATENKTNVNKNFRNGKNPQNPIKVTTTEFDDTAIQKPEMQKFLRKYAYYPIFRFDDYNNFNAINDKSKQIHSSIYNNSFLIGIVSSPAGSTLITVMQEFAKTQQSLMSNLKTAKNDKTAAETAKTAAETKSTAYETSIEKIMTGLNQIYQKDEYKKYFSKFNTTTTTGKLAKTPSVSGGGSNNVNLLIQRIETFINEISENNSKIQSIINSSSSTNSTKITNTVFKNMKMNQSNLINGKKAAMVLYLASLKVKFEDMISQLSNSNSRKTGLIKSYTNKIAPIFKSTTNNIAKSIVESEIKEKENENKVNLKLRTTSGNSNNNNIYAAAARLMSTGNTRNTSLNASTQQAVVNQSVVNPNVVNASVQQQPVVNAAQKVVAQAVQTVNTVTNATKQLVQEGVTTSKTLPTAQQLVNNAIKTTNPTIAINASVNAIANAKKALKELIKNVNESTNNIPENKKDDVINLLRKIKTNISKSNQNITMTNVRNAVKNQNNNFGNSIQPMFNTSKPKVTSSTNVKPQNISTNVAESIEQTNNSSNSQNNVLKKALNEYRSNKSDNKKSALKSAYNSIQNKNSINKSLNNNVKAILNPTQSSSTNVISEETTSENNYSKLTKEELENELTIIVNSKLPQNISNQRVQAYSSMLKLAKLRKIYSKLNNTNKNILVSSEKKLIQYAKISGLKKVDNTFESQYNNKHRQLNLSESNKVLIEGLNLTPQIQFRRLTRK